MALVEMTIEEVEEGHKRGKSWDGKEHVPDCFSRGFIEHVGDVKEEEGSGGIGWIQASLDLQAGQVDHGVKASFDGYAMLAQGEEGCCNGITIEFHDAFSCKTA